MTTILYVAALFLPISGFAHALKLDVHRVTSQQVYEGPGQQETIAFNTTFNIAPVVFGLIGDDGRQPAYARIYDISTSQFTFAIVEPENLPPKHSAEVVNFLAIERGRYLLPAETHLEVGTFTTKKTQVAVGNTGTSGEIGWHQVNFTQSFLEPPVVITEIQTAANTPDMPSYNNLPTPWITPTVRNVTTTGFEFALQRGQTVQGTVSLEETIGYLAISPGKYGTFQTSAGIVTFKTVITPENITGIGDYPYWSCTPQTTISSASFAGLHTQNNDEGGWLRHCHVTNDIGLTISEDRPDWNNSPAQLVSAPESAGILQFAGDIFTAELVSNLTVSAGGVTAEFVPSSGAPITDFFVPGAVVDMSWSIRNQGELGSDADSISTVISLPTDIALRIADYADPGQGPVDFISDAAGGDLTYSFVSLSDVTDDIDFSNDGGVTFDYVPSLANGDYDPAITHIRVTPQGQVYANDIANPNASAATISVNALVK